MKTEILNLGLIDKTLMPARSELSFQPFVAYLENLVKDQPLKKIMFENVIFKFKRNLSDREYIRIEEAAEFKDLLELIYVFLNPMATTATKEVWALSTPVPGEIFYSTDAFMIFTPVRIIGCWQGILKRKIFYPATKKGLFINSS